MKLEVPVVDFVAIDLDTAVCTTSSGGQDGSHCTNEAYSALTCENAAPRMCE